MIKNRNCDPNAGFFGAVRRYVFEVPAADTDLIVDNADISAANAGDVMTLANEWLPHPMSVFLTLTDAAAADLNLTIKVEGEDTEGNPATDTIAAAAGTTTVHGIKVFRRITKVTITAIDSEAANDKLDLGVTANAADIILGIPHELRKDSSTGVGGGRDTVKAIYRNGAIQTGAWEADPTVNGITAIAAAAASRMMVVLDPSVN